MEGIEEDEKPTILRFCNAFVGLMFAAQLAFSIILMSKNMKSVNLTKPFDDPFAIGGLFYAYPSVEYVFTRNGTNDVNLTCDAVEETPENYHFKTPDDFLFNKNDALTLITLSCSIFCFVGILTILVQIYNPFCKGQKDVHDFFRKTHFFILLIAQIFVTILELGFLVFFSQDYKDKFGKDLNIGFGSFGMSLGVMIIFLLLISAYYNGFFFSVKSVIGITSILQILWICCAIVVIIHTGIEGRLNEEKKIKWNFTIFIYVNLVPAALMLKDPRIQVHKEEGAIILIFVLMIVLFLVVSILGIVLSLSLKETKTYQRIALAYALLTIVIALTFFTGIVINAFNEYYSNVNMQFAPHKNEKSDEVCFQARYGCKINDSITSYLNFPRLEIYRYAWGCSIYYFVVYTIVVIIAVVLVGHIALSLVVPADANIPPNDNNDDNINTSENWPNNNNNDNDNNNDNVNDLNEGVNRRWRIDGDAGIDAGKYALPPPTQKDLFVF